MRLRCSARARFAAVALAVSVVAALAGAPLALATGVTNHGPSRTSRDSAASSISYYLEVPGLKSTVTSPSQFAGWFPVNSLSFAASAQAQAVGVPGQATGSHQVAFNSLTVTRGVDRSSPLFFEYMTEGKVFPTVTIDVVRSSAGGSPGTVQPFLSYVLEDAVISGDAHSGSSGNVPQEVLSFQFTQFTESYTPFTKLGVPKPPLSFCFNLLVQQSCSS